MTAPKFTHKVRATLINSMGDDMTVVQAARVSTNKDGVKTGAEGLINYLMAHRHGSVFEHCTFTFCVEVPLFTAAQFMRHRTFSYNQISARYSKMEGVFYIPGASRKLKNVGTSARPVMGEGVDEIDRLNFVGDVQEANAQAWAVYEDAVEKGIAQEIARTVLPENLMTRFYATCNARNLMHFLSLRTSHDDAAVASHPQYEIEQVALQMEEIFSKKMPLTFAAYVKNGRVA